jgi:hypothetical protein
VLVEFPATVHLTALGLQAPLQHLEENHVE